MADGTCRHGFKCPSRGGAAGWPCAAVECTAAPLAGVSRRTACAVAKTLPCPFDPSPVQADVWANTLQAYDPLWLRPQRALLSDTLRLLRGQAAAAKLVPPGATLPSLADGVASGLPGVPVLHLRAGWPRQHALATRLVACKRARTPGPTEPSAHRHAAWGPAVPVLPGCPRTGGPCLLCWVVHKDRCRHSALGVTPPSSPRSGAERAGPSHKQGLCRPGMERDGECEPKQRVCAHPLPRLGL